MSHTSGTSPVTATTAIVVRQPGPRAGSGAIRGPSRRIAVGTSSGTAAESRTNAGSAGMISRQ